MNEPIYQAWRTITPVEGKPIPEGTEFRSAIHGCVKWGPCRSDGRFASVDAHFEWRVPVPVIPEDVAVDLVLMNSEPVVHGVTDGQFRVEVAGNLEVGTLNKLRELVIAKLRELSQERCGIEEPVTT